MKLRYKIGGGLVALIGAAIVLLGIALSYESDCGPMPEIASGPESMMAIRYQCYGAPEVLQLVRSEKPVIGDDEVLVKVHAAAVNPLDWHYMRGKPYILRLQSGLGAPDDSRLGVDFSGTVESVGKNVTRFKAGDEVFGGAAGAFAEYLAVREDRAIALKPENMSFEQAASVNIAGITALQGLRDKGQVAAGQKVLINGASGGVGTFAVQIAKASGAEVTGVCSSRNLEMVRSIGADHVIDYRQQSFIDNGQRYDLILDMVGNHALTKVTKVLEPNGTVVNVGSSNKGNFIGPLIRPLQATLLSPFVDSNLVNLLAHLKQEDLETLADLMRAGQLTPIIDRTYRLAEVPEAIRYSEEGHARGKIIILVD
jgi:NADPH:quinone reductase-like Zn-dependent oxidoreductase